MKQKRFKRYTPQEREYPAFEPWEFEKEMDLQTVSIQVNEASYKQHNYKMIPRYYRTVVRRPDEDGKFKWLQIELEEMSQKFSRSMEEIMNIFAQVSCDKTKLRERLEGSTYCTWKKIEDLTLKNYFEAVQLNGGHVNGTINAQYQCLVEEKGLDEIAARNKFLGFDP